MAKKRPFRRRDRDRKPLNLNGLEPRSMTVYYIGFEVKTPPGINPDYVRRETPPTTNIDEARAAFEQLRTQGNDLAVAGVRDPQLIARTVTDVILEQLGGPPAWTDNDNPAKQFQPNVTPAAETVTAPTENDVTDAEKQAAREALAELRNRSKLKGGSQ